MIIRFAQENPHWGYGKIEGELLKLDYKASQTTIRNVLHRHGILPQAFAAAPLVGVTS